MYIINENKKLPDFSQKGKPKGRCGIHVVLAQGRLRGNQQAQGQSEL